MRSGSIRYAIEETVKSSRLGNAIFDTQHFDHSTLYRIADDIPIDDRTQILREHAVWVAGDWQADGKLIGALNDWASRYGVGSVTVCVPNKLPLQMKDIVRKLSVHVVEYANSVRHGDLPFDSPKRETQAPRLPTGSMRIPADIVFEAYLLLARIFADEECIICHDLRYPYRKMFHDYAVGIGQEDGAYDVYIRKTADQHSFYYRFWRLGIKLRQDRAREMKAHLQYSSREEPPISTLFATLKLAIEYFDELLYGSNPKKIIKKLGAAYDDLRKEESLRELVRLLDSKSLLQTREVLRIIANLRGTGAIKTLSRLLRSPEKEIRRWAVEAMARLRTPAVAYYLKRPLRDRNNLVRLSAIDALGAIGGRSAVRILSEHVKNVTSQEEYDSVLYALSRTDSALAFRTLLGSLLSEDQHLAESACWPLSNLLSNRRNIAVIRRTWNSLSEGHRRRIVALLARKIGGGNLKLAETSIELFSALREPSTIPIVVGALNSEVSHLEYQAAKCLGVIGGSDAKNALVNALQLRGSKVNWAVIEAIGMVKAKKAIPLLLSLLRDEAHTRSVIEALGMVQAEEAIPCIQRLATNNRSLAPEAAQALTRIGALKAADQVRLLCPRETAVSIRDERIRSRSIDGRDVSVF